MIFEEPRRRRPAIGLTSLIDVIFILIVFFMLVSSFEHFETVPLTVSSGAQSAERADKILALEILRSGVRSLREPTIRQKPPWRGHTKTLVPLS